MRNINPISATDLTSPNLAYFSEANKEEVISLIKEGKKVFKVYTGMVNKHHSLLEIIDNEVKIAKSNSYRDWYELAFPWSDSLLTIAVKS